MKTLSANYPNVSRTCRDVSDKAAVMQHLSGPNNATVSQQAERGSVQSADSSAVAAEGHLL